MQIKLRQDVDKTEIGMQIKLREVCRYVVDKTQRGMQTKLRGQQKKLRQVCRKN